MFWSKLAGPRRNDHRWDALSHQPSELGCTLDGRWGHVSERLACESRDGCGFVFDLGRGLWRFHDREFPVECRIEETNALLQRRMGGEHIKPCFREDVGEEQVAGFFGL